MSGDWREVTIAEALQILRRWCTSVLLWLGLIEYRSVTPKDYPRLRIVPDQQEGQR